MKPTPHHIKIEVDLYQDKDGFVIASKKDCGVIIDCIISQGSTLSLAEEQFLKMVKWTNLHTHERSEELRLWKPFSKGNWGVIGGTWFDIFGINVYFRYGKGMIGGWYVPLTKLNIRISNYWLN